MNSREACKEKPLVLPVVAAPGGDQCCRQPMLSLPQSVGGCLGLGMGSCRLLPSAGWVRTCSSASYFGNVPPRGSFRGKSSNNTISPIRKVKF